MDIRSRIIVILLTIGALSAAAIGWIGFQSGRENLRAGITSELSVRRDLTADGIDAYFRQTRSDLSALAQDSAIRQALERMPALFNAIPDALPDQKTRLLDFYQKSFLSSLPGTATDKGLADTFVPTQPSAQTLQAIYLAGAVPASGQQSNPQLSRYQTLYARIDPGLSAIAKARSYRDLILIDPKGSVVYSAAKNVDFATNLNDGPFDSSGLASAFRAAREAQGTRLVHIQDYAFYRPAHGKPTAFMSTGVYSDGRFVGVLVVELSTDRLQALVSQAAAIGSSGEVYVAGADGLLRTDLRSFTKEPKAFISEHVKQGADSSVLDQMRRFNSGVGLLNVDNDAVKTALKGDTAVLTFPGIYSGKPLLAAVKPLDIEGLDWAIVAEVPVAEAYAPINEFQRRIVITVTALFIAITLFAMWVAVILTRPISTLIRRAKAVAAGDFETPMRLQRSDEFGELSIQLQGLTDSLRERRDVADHARRRVEGLLSQFMPARIVRALRNVEGDEGVSNIREPVAELTIVMAELIGYEKLVDEDDLVGSVGALDALIQKIDQATEQAGIEKVRTSGPSYVASAGLSAPQIDHAQRAIGFALDVVGIVDRFSTESGVNLSVTVGVASGSVVAAVVGGKLLAFELFGVPKEEARHLSKTGDPDEVRANAATVDRLGDAYTAKPAADGSGWIIERASTPLGAAE